MEHNSPIFGDSIDPNDNFLQALLYMNLHNSEGQ